MAKDKDKPAEPAADSPPARAAAETALVRAVDSASGAVLAAVSGVEVTRSPGPGADQATFAMRAADLGDLLRLVRRPGRVLAVTDRDRVQWAGVPTAAGDAVTLPATRKGA